jgi:hypothetical protein
MKLIVQPHDGVRPLVEAIDSAKRSISIAVCPFDFKAVEKTLRLT